MVGAIVLITTVVATLSAPGAADDAEAPEEAPPAGQTYTGVKRCSACHFEQYLTWKKTGHAKAFEILTAKYQTDQKCLKCHTTGLGEETGYKDQATTSALAGVTCETCHGPGSQHEVIGQKYAKVKTLTPEQEKEVRGSIWKMKPKNVCVECHNQQAHKKSETPPELQTKK
jgi:hypothetical protein